MASIPQQAPDPLATDQLPDQPPDVLAVGGVGYDLATQFNVWTAEGAPTVQTVLWTPQ